MNKVKLILSLVLSCICTSVLANYAQYYLTIVNDTDGVVKANIYERDRCTHYMGGIPQTVPAHQTSSIPIHWSRQSYCSGGDSSPLYTFTLIGKNGAKKYGTLQITCDNKGYCYKVKLQNLKTKPFAPTKGETKFNLEIEG